MSEVLELANRLRDLSDDDLAGLLRERAISPHHLRDFFDLAEAMLHVKNAEAWLASLNLDELQEVAGKSNQSPFSQIASLVFHSASNQRAEFGEKFKLFLATLNQDGAGRSLDSDGFDQEAGEGSEPIKSSSQSVSSEYDQVAIRVFETCQALTEVIYDLEHHRVRSVGKAGVASSEVKRLALHLSIDTEQVKQVFQLAQYCDLIALEGERWALTTNSQRWLDWSITERWVYLTKFWLMLVGDAGTVMFRRRWHELERGHFTHFLASVYPLGAQEQDSRASRLVRFAEAIGLTHGDRVNRLFEAVIDSQFESAASLLGSHLPKTQDRIVVQADLSIVTPGPLSSSDERAMREFVETEQVGIASRMRLTPLSLMNAFEGGVTPDQVREILMRLSQGKLPQPVEYLINDTAKKFGRIRVSTDSERGSVIQCSDELLATEILHESSLRPFALEAISNQNLRTKYDSEVVYFGLRDAGYLAIRVDESGKTIAPMKTASLHQESSLDTVLSTIERLRQADARVTESGDDESMLRQIQLAIKNRARIKVNYRGKDGSEYEFVLEPTGLANGRLRGTDRRADIERTLTLSNITRLSLV